MVVASLPIRPVAKSETKRWYARTVSCERSLVNVRCRRAMFVALCWKEHAMPLWQAQILSKTRDAQWLPPIARTGH